MVDLKIELPPGFLEEEERCGYTVSAEMKKLWAVELDLLAETDRICRKYDIQYMAAGGTLLGAVRHRGFIPWDDDIDLNMTWENYQRFREIAPKEFRHPYVYQDGYTDPSSIRGHIQIRNSLTTAIRKSEMGKDYPYNQGIFIDIFPLDTVPDDENERSRFFQEIRKQRIKIVKLSRRGQRYTAAVRRKQKGLKKIVKDAIHEVVEKTGMEKRAFQNYETLLHRYNGQQSKREGVLCLYNMMEKLVWDSEVLHSELQYVPFEFMQMPVPSRCEEMLTAQYGNWQQFSVGKTVHGDLIIDTDKPYTEYLSKR